MYEGPDHSQIARWNAKTVFGWILAVLAFWLFMDAQGENGWNPWMLVLALLAACASIAAFVWFWRTL